MLQFVSTNVHSRFHSQVMPSGKIVRFPRGTTAGDAITQYTTRQGLFYRAEPANANLVVSSLSSASSIDGDLLEETYGAAEADQVSFVSLNNRLVAAATVLKDGDLLQLPQPQSPASSPY